MREIWAFKWRFYALFAAYFASFRAGSIGGEKQIPCGNDRKKSKGNGKSKDNGKSKCKGKSKGKSKCKGKGNGKSKSKCKGNGKSKSKCNGKSNDWLGFVVSHPSDKNNGVARMGHPLLFLLQRGQKKNECKNLSRGQFLLAARLFFYYALFPVNYAQVIRSGGNLRGS